jgi:hypothetical protein
MGNAWENYSKSYNLLSDEIQKAGIALSLLSNVISNYEKVINGNDNNDKHNE